MKIKHFLYNAFIIEDEGSKIAIDPGQDLWLFKLNSLIPKSEWKGVTHVLTTHGDPDHFSYAVALARNSGADVVCGEALMEEFLSAQVNNVHKIETGSVVSVGKLKIEGLRAKHGPLPIKLLGGFIQMENEVAKGDHGGKTILLGSVKVLERQQDMQVYSRGTIKLFFGLVKLIKENIDFARGSIGFKITLADKTLVNLGDTVLQKEWEGLKPDVLMIPIGGRVCSNTMDEAEALQAVKLIKPKKVIPCHYNGDFLWRKNINPADDDMFKREVEKMGIDCHIMQHGDVIEL